MLKGCTDLFSGKLSYNKAQGWKKKKNGAITIF